MSSVHPCALHSFPTRRSSDLGRPLVLGWMSMAGADMVDPFAARGLVPRLPVLRAARGTICPGAGQPTCRRPRSEEHTSELQSHVNLVCRLLLEKKNKASQCGW